MSSTKENIKTMIDLFAGTGAFSYVSNKYGIDCVFANDFCKESEEIYNINHNIKLTNKDLNDIQTSDIPDHDLMCAGFPCQPFSIAGKKEGFDDVRSNVFWKIIDIMKIKSPRVVILENVKNLKSHDKGNTFKVIEESITSIGYKIKYKILNTCKLSYVPQNRERIYIVCFRYQEDFDKFDFNFKEVMNENISYLLETKIDDKYYYTSKIKIYDSIIENVIKHIDTNVVYQYRRFYFRENKSGVCPTLTANMGTGGHNVPMILDDKGTRKLTPRECFNLQGFDKGFKLPNLSDSLLYKLAGNAVSIPIINLIIKKIKKL